MDKSLKHKGIIIIISGPSGVGKSTLLKALITTNPEFKLSISFTTRPARSNEIHAQDYYFISKQEFESLIEQNQLLEYTFYSGHYYGSSVNLIKHLSSHQIIVFDIDWHGAKALKKVKPHDTVSIFILPPSLQVLQQRLLNRHINFAEANQRLLHFNDQIKHINDYDYIIVNDILEKALTKLQAIVSAECHRNIRIEHIPFLIKNELTSKNNIPNN